MTQRHEIVPGKSIGPFALGMTRGEIEALQMRPMKHLDGGKSFFPMIAISDAALDSDFPSAGVTVSYDAAGRCCKLGALFSMFAEPPVFTLLGQVANGMRFGTVVGLLNTIASDVSFGYGSVESAAAGVSACQWEATDDFIVSITVAPPVDAESS